MFNQTRSSASTNLDPGIDHNFAYNTDDNIHDNNPEDVGVGNNELQVTSTPNTLDGVESAGHVPEATPFNYVFPFHDEDQEIFDIMSRHNTTYYNVFIDRYEDFDWMQPVDYRYLPEEVKIKALFVKLSDFFWGDNDVPLLFLMTVVLYNNEGLDFCYILENVLETISENRLRYFDLDTDVYYRVPGHPCSTIKFYPCHWWGVRHPFFVALNFIDNNPGFLTPLGVLLRAAVKSLNLHDVQSQLNGNNGEWTNEDDIDHVRMRWNNLVNRGAARRGGNARGPFLEGHRRHIPNAADIAHRLDFPQRPLNVIVGENGNAADWWVREYHAIRTSTKFSTFPNAKSTWSFDELNEATGKFVLFDPLGSPFCGLAAIDLATGKSPVIKDYLEKCKLLPSPYTLGTNVSLKEYCFERGFNLRIIRPVMREGVVDESDVMDYINSDAWDWVVLYVKNGDGSIPDRIDDGEVVKHCYVVVDNRGDCSNMDIPLLEFDDRVLYGLAWSGILNILWSLGVAKVTQYFVSAIGVILAVMFMLAGGHEVLVNGLFQSVYNASPYIGMLAGFIDEFLLLMMLFKTISIGDGYQFVQYRYNKTNADVRNIRERRDRIESQDHYAEFRKGWSVYICGLPILYFDLGLATDKIVSVVRVNQFIKDSQCLSDTELTVSMLSVLKTTVINTDASLPNIYRDTMEYGKWYVKYSQVVNKQQLEKHTVAYNASGSQSYVGKLNIVALNQLAVVVGDNVHRMINGEISFSHPYMNFTNNGFKKFWPAKLKEKKKRVVSYAPMGSLITSKTQLGPGQLCITEPYSLLAALAGRSMIKLPVEVEEFKEFAMNKIQEYVDKFDFNSFIDEDPIVNYRENNKGKRSKKYIDRKIKDYENFLQGNYRPKYLRNSCFVKFEDSSKVVDGVNRPRPRLIMTMSDYFSMVLSPLVQVVHLWNKGWISKYQVKNLTPDEFVSKVASFCEKDHIVTDYSAFESSVSGMFKDIEVSFVKKLLTKCGCQKTLRKYLQLDRRHRKLNCDIGEFLISSRCSGDYFTSTLNCLINLLINEYSAYKTNNNNLQLIVEGDDGITLPSQVDTEVINALGFDFSSNLKGSIPADIDFLRVRWDYSGPLVNIGRCLKKLFWIDSQTQLPLRRQKAIIRAKALSYLFSSPGCPVLTAAINYILKQTAGSNYFKGIEQYLGNYKTCPLDLTKIGRNYGINKVDDYKRSLVAAGAQGFPPIPVNVQVLLENNFAKGNFYVGSLLNEYEDISTCELNDEWKKPVGEGELSKELSELIELLACTYDELVHKTKTLNPEIEDDIDHFLASNAR